jgi:hypothetical protein
MKKTNFFNLKPSTLILTLVLFVVLILLFLPVKMNVLCKPGENCKPMVYFTNIFNLNKTMNQPTFIGLDYVYILFYFVACYLLSCLIIYLKKRYYKK